MFRTIQLLPVLAVATLLAACGGGHDNAPSTTAATTPTRGQLLSTPTMAGSYSASDLLSMLSNDPLGKLLLQLTFSPTCTVNVYHMKYATVGGAGEATTASGALMVPTGSAASCQGARPLVMYAHGTNASKTFNMADLTGNSEALLMASVFASQGYIVVAPNYAGYDTSTLPYHPYLNGDQQSKDMIDSLAAARSAYATASTSDNGKLFITGYSQGGYVAMATHKAMQAAGTVVTAAAPMSGPYALAAFGDAIFMGEVDMSAPANFDLLVTSYQHSYKNVYTSPTDVFEAQYAAGADELLPSATAITAIYSNGQLPQNALFNSTPPSPAYAAMTPATTPANLAASFALGFGTNDLVTNAYRLSLSAGRGGQPGRRVPDDDHRRSGCRAGFGPAAGFEEQRSQKLDADRAGSAVRRRQRSDRVLSQHAAHRGVLGFDGSDELGDPAGCGFIARERRSVREREDRLRSSEGGRRGGSGDRWGYDGAMAVLQVYHSTLVPPFCLYAVKSFFDGY